MEERMAFKNGNTTLSYYAGAWDRCRRGRRIESHEMDVGNSLTWTWERKTANLEYFVSKAIELNDMMDPSKGNTGNIIYNVSEVHIDDEHFGKHVELGQSWDRIGEFFGLFEKYSPLVTMGGRVIAKL